MVVVGNKVDLDKERVITFQRSQEWVDMQMSNASYLETSAKYNINVAEMFKQLLIRTYGLANNDVSSFIMFFVFLRRFSYVYMFYIISFISF